MAFEKSRREYADKYHWHHLVLDGDICCFGCGKPAPRPTRYCVFCRMAIEVCCHYNDSAYATLLCPGCYAGED